MSIASEDVHAEAEVRLGLQDVVELVRVEVGQEPEGVREHDEVAEGDAADREDGSQGREPLQELRPALVDGRDEVRPDLPQDDRQRQGDAEVDRDPENRREVLERAERRQLAAACPRAAG